jgi:ribosomal protein S3AE
MLEALKLLANKRDVPYQSLVKVFLSDKIERELTAKGHNIYSLHRIARKDSSR